MENRPLEPATSQILNSEDDPFKGVLGFNSISGWREYGIMARNYLGIAKTGPLRLLVLETWLFLDYTVARLLQSGLGIVKDAGDVIDIREQVLPSYLRSLSLVVKIRDINRELARPVPRMTMPMALFRHFKEHEPTLLDELIKTEERFLEGIGLFHETVLGQTMSMTQSRKARWVSDEWLKMTSRIDTAWRAKAEQLDRARNKAAHSYNELAIAAKLGFTGPDALELARAECRSIAGSLVDVTETSRWITELIDVPDV